MTGWLIRNDIAQLLPVGHDCLNRNQKMSTHVIITRDARIGQTKSALLHEQKATGRMSLENHDQHLWGIQKDSTLIRLRGPLQMDHYVPSTRTYPGLVSLVDTAMWTLEPHYCSSFAMDRSSDGNQSALRARCTHAEGNRMVRVH